jgi:amino acid transporter
MASPPAAVPAPAPGEPPRLARALGLRDLVLYGIIVIQPVAPMSPFGVIQEESHGHAATAVALALVAMLLTATSYGRMARVHPSAGSAFTYVGREIHPALGYVTGWSMALDYLLNPVICTLWCAKAIAGASGVPFGIWVVGLAALFTAINLRGVRAPARLNAALAAAMGAVIIVFLAATVGYITGRPEQAGNAGGAEASALGLTRPFYDPARWSTGAVLTGTSLAVLTFIGFDGISTLAEEVNNPRRNVLLATVLSCLAVGALAITEVYAAQLVWPASEPFPDQETAFAHVAGRAGGAALYITILATLTVANAGSAVGAQLGAARLLYGMGRSGALPRGFFGSVDPRHHVPRNNVLVVGLVAAGGAFLLEATGGYQLGAHLLNFGALIAFMGVNLAALAHAFLRERKRTAGSLLPPLGGFAVCFLLWWSLDRTAQIAGAAWLAGGVALGAWRTRGFRAALLSFEIPPAEAADRDSRAAASVTERGDRS